MTELTDLEIITLSFYSVMSIITILANGLVIISMCFIKNLRTTSNMFIVSLSFADLSIGLFTLPLRSMEILRFSFTFNIENCRVSHAFTLLNFTASVSNLVVITIDRYIAIIHPYLYCRLKYYTLRYVGGMLLVAWITVILLTYMPLYGWGSNGQSGQRKGRLGICRFSETLSQQFILTILITVLATSFLVIIPLYLRIFMVAKSVITKVQPLDESSTDTMEASRPSSSTANEPSIETKRQKLQENKKKRKKFLQSWKTTKTMFLIVIIFLISWMGFVVTTLMFIVCKSCANSKVVLTGTIVIYLGSALNPFIYFIRFKSFQQEVKRIWKKLGNCCRDVP